MRLKCHLSATKSFSRDCLSASSWGYNSHSFSGICDPSYIGTVVHCVYESIKGRAAWLANTVSVLTKNLLNTLSFLAMGSNWPYMRPKRDEIAAKTFIAQVINKKGYLYELATLKLGAYPFV